MTLVADYSTQNFDLYSGLEACLKLMRKTNGCLELQAVDCSASFDHQTRRIR